MPCQAAGLLDAGCILPGQQEEERDGEGGSRPLHPFLHMWVPAMAKVVPVPKLCQGRCFPWVLLIPQDKPGWLQHSRVMGSQADNGLCEPVPWPGECPCWELQPSAPQACPQQAPTCARLVLAPMGAERVMPLSKPDNHSSLGEQHGKGALGKHQAPSAASPARPRRCWQTKLAALRQEEGMGLPGNSGASPCSAFQSAFQARSFFSAFKSR